MNRIIFITAAVVLLVASGFVHGLWTERWGTSQELMDAAARLERVPLEINGWIGEAGTADAEAFERAGAKAYWSRNYRHGDKSVTVILMCGRAGRMAVHTPEVCYRGIGFEPKGGIMSYTVDKKSQFRTAQFQRDQGTVSELRILWSWGDGKDWKAPSNPRWEFRGQPFLYKLYLVREVTGNTGKLDGDASVEFIRQFLPVLERSLSASAA